MAHHNLSLLNPNQMWYADDANSTVDSSSVKMSGQDENSMHLLIFRSDLILF